MPQASRQGLDLRLEGDGQRRSVDLQTIPRHGATQATRRCRRRDAPLVIACGKPREHEALAPDHVEQGRRRQRGDVAQRVQAVRPQALERRGRDPIEPRDVEAAQEAALVARQHVQDAAHAHEARRDPRRNLRPRNADGRDDAEARRDLSRQRLDEGVGTARCQFDRGFVDRAPRDVLRMRANGLVEFARQVECPVEASWQEHGVRRDRGGVVQRHSLMHADRPGLERHGDHGATAGARSADDKRMPGEPRRHAALGGGVEVDESHHDELGHGDTSPDTRRVGAPRGSTSGRRQHA